MEFGSKFAYFNDDMFDGDEAEELFEEELNDAQSFDIEAAFEEVDDRRTCYLEILDTAGQEEYSALRDEYFTTSSGFLIVYDVTDTQSFTDAQETYKECKKASGKKEPFCVLVGNKTDLSGDRKVKSGEGKKFARRTKNMEFVETSAKSGNNVAKAFKSLIRIIPRDGRQYKVTVLGAGGVGKSAIVLRYTREEFVDEYDPTIEDVFRKTEIMAKQLPLSKKKKGRKLKPQPKKPMKKKIGNVVKANTNIISLNIGSIAEPVKIKKRRKKKKKAEDKKPKEEDALPPLPSIVEEQNKNKDDDDKLPPLPSVVIEEEEEEDEVEEIIQKVELGKPIECKGCAGVLNKFCRLAADGRHWICTFCETMNPIIDVNIFKIPDTDTIEFCLQPAPKIYKDDDLIIFVVDISGSMCVSTEIPRGFGMIQVGGSREQDDMRKMIIEMNKTLPNDDQMEVPPARRNDRFVSRIQCMQSAIDLQLEELLKQHPERRVVVITFNSTISVFGPKCGVTRVEGEEKLENFDELMGTGVSKLFKYEELEPISKNKDQWKKVVQKLVEGGQTALGPALVVALGLCSQDKELRKEVIVCTDGVANIGLGKKVDSNMTHEERLLIMEDGFQKVNNYQQKLVDSQQKGVFSDLKIVCEFDQIAAANPFKDPRESFFEKLGTIALDSHTTISAIGIADEDDCDMEMMETLANTTGGSIHVVNPLELQRKMREILDQEKIAQDVRVKFVMDPAFQFEEGEDADLTSIGMKKVNPKRRNEMEMRLGVAHQETDLTLEFSRMKKIRKKKKMKKKKKPKKKEDAKKEEDGEKKKEVIIEEESEEESEEDEKDKNEEDGKKKKKMKSTVPFQSQITYTKLDGSKFVRIQTLQREVTKKREAAEKEANYAVVSQHNIKKSSAMGKKGRLRDARLNLYKVQKMQKRNMAPMLYSRNESESEKKEESIEWMYRANKLDNELKSLEAEDEDSDDGDSGGGGFFGGLLGSGSRSSGSKKKKKKKISDKSRGIFHKMEKESISKFKSAKRKNIGMKKRHLNKYKK